MGGCCQSKPMKIIERGRRSYYTSENLGEVGNALRELVVTERSYGMHMRYLVEKYLDPLRSEELFFDSTDLMAFNSIVLDLNQVQAQFQRQLEKATENLTSPDADISDIVCNVSDAFIKSEQTFEIYSRYILCMSKVQKIESSIGNKHFVDFLDLKFKSLKPDPSMNVNCQPFNSVILKPFQRMALYPLILERVEKKCQDGTEDKEQITKAIQAIKNVIVRMNDTMANQDQAEYQVMLNELGILEYEYKKSHEN